MTREDIEKASKEEIKLAGSPSALDLIIKKFCRESFICGAEWRINSVWHDATEKPKLGELIIVEVYGKIWDYGKYDVCDTIHPKARWAYVKDLLPKEDEK